MGDEAERLWPLATWWIHSRGKMSQEVLDSHCDLLTIMLNQKDFLAGDVEDQI